MTRKYMADITAFFAVGNHLSIECKLYQRGRVVEVFKFDSRSVKPTAEKYGTWHLCQHIRDVVIPEMCALAYKTQNSEILVGVERLHNAVGDISESQVLTFLADFCLLVNTIEVPAYPVMGSSDSSGLNDSLTAVMRRWFNG